MKPLVFPSYKATFLVSLFIWGVLGQLSFASVGAAPCTPACLEADTNVPSTVAIMIRVDSSTVYTLNQTLVFPYNTTHTIQLMNATVNVPLGVRYVFRQWNWIRNGYPIQWSTTVNMTTPQMLANYTSTTNGPFMAQFDKQFALTLTFTDPSGQPVSPPSSVVLANGQTTVTLTTYANQWLTAGSWTVADATWEGGSQAVIGTPTIDLTQAGSTVTVALKAYPAALQIVDSQNRPVVGATVTITFDNVTTRSFATDSQGTIQLGRVPIGPYTAHISYQNQDMGTYSVDASLNPTDTIKLSTVQMPDTSPPAWPPNSSLAFSSLTSSSVILSWGNATDDVGVANYRIYDGGTLLATLSNSAHTYAVIGLTPGTTHVFRVEACDAAGNCDNSNLSTTLSTLSQASAVQNFWYLVPIGLFAGLAVVVIYRRNSKKRSNDGKLQLHVRICF